MGRANGAMFLFDIAHDPVFCSTDTGWFIRGQYGWGVMLITNFQSKNFKRTIQN
jgi:hypothetical protein